MKLTYRIEEVAEMLSISKRTVYRLLADGKLKSVSLDPERNGVRITDVSIKTFLRENEVSPERFKKDKKDGDNRRRMISEGVKL